MPPATETRLRVRYAETDQMGVVYYANYLVWMEVGRVELCKSCGFNYRDMEVEDGIFLAVAEANSQAIQKIAAAIQTTGGMEAVNLKVAEQYVNAFANVAKQGTTLIVPGDLSNMSSMIASALTIVNKGKGATEVR